MVTTYTDPKRVSTLLQYFENVNGKQIRKVFSANSNPTYEEVEDIINETEEIIDEYCETSWKENNVVNEYHDFRSSMNRWGSYIDRDGYRLYAIKLKKLFPRTFSASDGDKIEVWTGTTWNDFLANQTEGQAMHDGDYWVDYEHGKISFFNQFPQVGARKFRITYRYGDTTVPLGIRRVSTLLVGSMINERYELKAFADKDSSPALNQADRWREMAYRILEDYRINVVEVV